MLRVFAVAIFAAWASGAAAQGCPEIRSAPGAWSGDVSGWVSDGHPMCYDFVTGAEQTARLQLWGSDNACFTLAGVVDCRVDFSFVTGAGRYQVTVYQLLRRLEYEPFTLRLTIR